MKDERFLINLKNSKKKVETAITAVKNGKGIIIFDEKNRENEGDIIFSAEKMTIDQMIFTLRYGSGIVCLSLTEEYCEKLKLPMMVKENTSKWKTGFTITIEAANGITTGVSAKDRLKTIKTAISDNVKPSDLDRPGHIFPLKAHSGGIKKRQGHTEATIEMMNLAGLKPAGVLSELMNKDGSMSNFKEVIRFSINHNMPIISVNDLIFYKKNLRFLKKLDI